MRSDEKQREFFKNYDTVLPFIKNVFYYGSLSSIDFEADGICKSSKYSVMKRTLEYAFGTMLEENKNSSGKNALRIRINHFEDPHKAFFRIFSLKSFVSANKLVITLYLLRRLSIKHSISVNDAIDQDMITDEKIPESIYNSSMIRRILNEMAEKGIVKKVKDRYYFNADISSISDNENIIMLTDLCTNIYPLSIYGSSIQNKLDLQYNSPFIFKHLHLGQIFNDILIHKLLDFIIEKKHLCIKTARAELHDLLPYRIITDRYTGRQYLFAVYIGDMQYPEYMLLRLENIKGAEPENSICDVPSDESLAEKYRTAFRYSFTGTTILQRNDEPQTGTIIYDNAVEWKIRQKFPETESAAVDETHSCIHIKVNSLTEIKPWLRSNAEHIHLTESSDKTYDEMKEEMKEWRQMYGIT